MSSQIIVGYDGTAPSREAVLWAAAEADVRGARLKIVACYDLPVGGDAIVGWGATEMCAALLRDTEARVLAIRAVVKAEHADLDVTTDVSAGPAGMVLVDNADPDDLLVVGASTHEGAAAFWLGNTPRYAVRHSAAPVVVVRGVASRNPPDRVVVGIDGSDESLEALRWAGDEADRHHVNLVVVHSWSYPYLPVDTGGFQARDLTRIDAATVLERAVRIARERVAASITDVLVEGSPTSALLEAVRDGDLLVVGSRGRGALRSAVFGSTVNAVLDRAAVPVVVIPQRDDD